MKKAQLVVRVLMGAAWVFFGLNGFLHFFTPPPLTGAAGQYMAGMMAGGYVFPVISAVELVAGLMLLSGRFVPLALVLLAPILVNIIGYHVMLDLKGTGPGALLTVMELFLAWTYRDAFKGLLTAKYSPQALPAAAPAAEHVRAKAA